jgi:AI-2 transport protein TqsA
MPKLVALAITIIITIVVGLAFASLAVWAFGRVGRSFVADAGRYQALYGNVVTSLEGHGIEVPPRSPFGCLTDSSSDR